ncbi:Hint domain-containing protein [uncultured Roseovarius sp.]|uniref:Hint domain-containing protein n=1 Tax=uncultured Roseovarius sp. TaxID=293344 RepID=UPI0026323A94|nr:Hint domain-containing protein [uncultured Roseovarius sp.]
MPGYISEYQYMGLSDEEFIEIAVPNGTDVSSYSIVLYQYDGTIVESYSLGTTLGTFGGQDVYAIDDTTPGFDSFSGQGEIYADDAIALVDDNGNVLQFISHWGNTVSAVEGPASGLNSISVGTANFGESLQSDDGGASYYSQSTTNQGSIPACYGPGTRIATPRGYILVENLRAGDHVLTRDRGIQQVRWVWSGGQPLDDVEPHQKPVLIAKNALASGLPDRDLIVSNQHRVVVGVPGQLDEIFTVPTFVPAKALVEIPGIRHMVGKKSMHWHHFVCDDHCVVMANNIASETLFLGSQIVRKLNSAQRRQLSQSLGRHVRQNEIQPMALPSLTKRQAQEVLARGDTKHCEVRAKKDDDSGKNTMRNEHSLVLTELH